MTSLGNGERTGDDLLTHRVEAEPDDWVRALTCGGPEQVAAQRRLHALMVRAAAHQVWRLRGLLPDPSPQAVDVLANQAADEAMATLLAKLPTFQGRSRFTTWAYKFAIVQAGSDVHRLRWRHREVELRDLELPAPSGDDPEEQAQAADLAGAIAAAMHEALTPYQRRIAVALLVDGVPIDVLAERLGTTRGALYKTLHEARTRLRAELVARGYLLQPPAPPPTDTAAPEAGDR